MSLKDPRPLGKFKGEEGRCRWCTWEDIDTGDWAEEKPDSGGKVQVVDHAFSFFSEIS